MFSQSSHPKNASSIERARKGLVAIMVLNCLVIVAGTGVADGAIIQLKEGKCVTAASVVTLGDIAEIHEPDPQRGATLRGLIVVPSPAPGRETMVDLQQIRSRLQVVGINLAEIEFSGRSQIWISSEVEREVRLSSIPETQQQRIQQLVEKVVSQSLEQRYPHAGRFQVSASLTEEQIRILSQANGDQLRASGGVPPFMNSQSYLVQYTDKDRRESVLQIPCSVEIIPQVLAVLHPVEKGHVIQVADLGWRNATDLELKKLSVTQPEQVLGRETTRPLALAEAITTENVRVVPLVSTGDIITVYSRRGGVSVRMDLRSLGTGGRGELIRVQGMESRTHLQVRVTGYHEGEIVNEDTEAVEGGRVGLISGSIPQFATQSRKPGTGGYAR